MSLFRYNSEIHDNPEYHRYRGGYDPDQPRVPAGHSDGGQWTRGAYSGSAASEEVDTPRTRIAFLPVLPPLVAATAGGTGAGAALETAGAIVLGLGVFSALSQRNSRDQQAVIEFNAKQFRPDAKREIDIKSIAMLTRSEVDKACPGFKGVRSLTDDASESVRKEEQSRTARGEELRSMSQLGTAVHTVLRQEIEAPDDPKHRAIVRAYNLGSEVSLLKGIAEAYGAKGSIRIDVLEKVNNNTVCVYDIKTGKSGLSLPRMMEIAENVAKHYGDIQRIIVTEARPMFGPRRLPQ